MFTICPGCNRQFRIYAEHIKAASGQVRCGFCQKLFNVLGQLHDESIKGEAHFAARQTQVQKPGKTAQKNNAALDKSVSVPAHTAYNVRREIAIAMAEIGIQEALPKTQNQRQKQDKSQIVDELSVIGLELAQANKGKNTSSLLFWSASSLFLMLILLGQLTWFNRDAFLTKYPQFTPYFKQACHALNCNLIRKRDTQAIVLVNRDVRIHQGDENTILVDATMLNQSFFRQPYPKVQLALFDVNGLIVGHRIVHPVDYLNEDIDIEAGMPVNIVVYFSLAISGPIKDAVGFELHFI